MGIAGKVMFHVSQGQHGPAFGNVRELDRTLSILGGTALAGFGIAHAIRKRSFLGGALALLGGSLIMRGVRGHSRVFERLGWNPARPSNVERAHSDAISSLPLHQGVAVECTMAFDRTVDELYRFWRNLENLPLFMKHLKSVRMTGLTTSHWVARAPLGREVEWDAEIINDQPNQLIAWRSLEGSDVANSGSVHFQPLGLSGTTAVKVELRYNPPAGKVGAAIARLLGEEPKHQIQDDLERLRKVLDAGEVPLIGGQPFLPKPV